MNTPAAPGLVMLLTWRAPCGCELDLFLEYPEQVSPENLVDTGARLAGMLLTQANNRLPRHQCHLVSPDNPNGIAQAH
ncbi:MAG: hypothetical protein AB7V08_13965 [Elusimicrobiales bacterium]